MYYVYVCIPMINVKEWTAFRTSGIAVKFVEFCILFNNLPNAAIWPLFRCLTHIVFYRYTTFASHSTVI